jgi:hypothetical protein
MGNEPDSEPDLLALRMRRPYHRDGKSNRRASLLANGSAMTVFLASLLSATAAWPQAAPVALESTTPLRQTQDSEQTAADPADPSDPASSDAEAERPEMTAQTAEETEAALDAAALQELKRQNLAEQPVDVPLRKKPDESDLLTPGIAVGTLTLRPALTESLGIERTRTGKATTTRSYLETGFKGSLVSDWSLHELRVEADGTWQKTLSGIPEDDPQGSISAALRIDLSDATKANLKLGYALERESITAANAIDNATTQAEVSTYTASAEITHDLGVIRGTAGIDLSRDAYGDALLDNGTLVSQEDRNANTATLRGRIGYELSQILIPFVEASAGQTIYDSHLDDLGYVRDSRLYALKAGIEADLGEKLRGELSAGYAYADFEDARLKALSALTFDGKASWSPNRGTSVELGLKTEIEPSTTAGASGSVAYTADAALTQAIIDTLSGRLSASTTLRQYSLSSSADQNVVNLGAGLTWGISRSLDLTANTAWEKTMQRDSASSDVFTAGIGLTLKR